MKTQQELFERVRSHTQPDVSFLLAKGGLIHLISTAVSLAICPQFGFRFGMEGHGLMGVFMRFGHEICFILCGIFYVASFLLALTLVMNRFELRALWSKPWFSSTFFGLMSLGSLWMYGADFVQEVTLLWLVGSVLTLAVFIPLHRRWLNSLALAA